MAIDTGRVYKSPEEMEFAEKEFWVKYWLTGSLAIETMAVLSDCFNMMNQLRINNVGVDLHIQDVSPVFSGWLTTSVGPVGKFNGLNELQLYLQSAIGSIKSSEDNT